MASIEPRPHTGEAVFYHLDRQYTLALNHLAWSIAQRHCGVLDGKALSRSQILLRIAEGFDHEAYALFFGMLQRHHPEIATLSQAADLMEAVGPSSVDAVRLALGLSTPDPQDAAELREGERPPTAQARTRTSAKRISASDSAV